MNTFADEASIEVNSGRGGDGIVSFRREKYAPKGGPDGGDGGRGGDVIFSAVSNLKTLSHLKHKKVFKAGDGKAGGSRKKHGKDGEDIVISVPVGTLIRDPANEEILHDFDKAGQTWTMIRGGMGGKGNTNFTSSTRQAPRISTKGKEGKSRQILTELRLIADVGLVGRPNAGKSTLLSRLTNAHPKIGSYPFTTRTPNMGALELYDREIVIADIPGLVEGAAGGAGLGIRFLKHIDRTELLAYLIDLGDPDFRDTVEFLEAELDEFAVSLRQKRRILIGTKLDLAEARENLVQLQKRHSREKVIGISAVTGEGLGECKQAITRLILEKDESSDTRRNI